MDRTPPIPSPLPDESGSFDISRIETADLPPLDGSHSGALTPWYEMPTAHELTPVRIAVISQQRGRRITQHEQLALELQARLADLQVDLTRHALEAGDLSREQYDLIAIMTPTLDQISRIRALDVALHAKMGILQTLRIHWQQTARDLRTHMEAAHSLRASTMPPTHSDRRGGQR